MEILKQLDDRLRNIETLMLSQKTVLTFDEVAAYTGLSRSYLYKLTSTGGIPCYKPQGKHIYFNKQEIDQWLMQGRKATTSEIETAAINYVHLKKSTK